MRRKPDRNWALGLGAAALLALSLVAVRFLGGDDPRERGTAAPAPQIPAAPVEPGFIGSQACAACHAAEHAR